MPEELDRIWTERKDNLHLNYSPNYRFEIALYCQPPNSPDLNVLDLGVFAALQNLQWKQQTKNINAMVERVGNVFEEWPTQRLNNIFLTLQTCMNKIVRLNGDNDYQITHMKKEQLERMGVLPRSIRATTMEFDQEMEEGEEEEEENNNNNKTSNETTNEATNEATN